MQYNTKQHKFMAIILTLCSFSFYLQYKREPICLAIKYVTEIKVRWKKARRQKQKYKNGWS